MQPLGPLLRGIGAPRTDPHAIRVPERPRGRWRSTHGALKTHKCGHKCSICTHTCLSGSLMTTSVHASISKFRVISASSRGVPRCAARGAQVHIAQGWTLQGYSAYFIEPQRTRLCLLSAHTSLETTVVSFESTVSRSQPSSGALGDPDRVRIRSGSPDTSQRWSQRLHVL